MKTLIVAVLVALSAAPAYAMDCQGDVYQITQDWLKRHYGVSQCAWRHPIPEDANAYWYCSEGGQDDYYLILEYENWRPGEYSQALVRNPNDPNFGLQRFNCTCYYNDGEEPCYQW